MLLRTPLFPFGNDDLSKMQKNRGKEEKGREGHLTSRILKAKLESDEKMGDYGKRWRSLLVNEKSGRRNGNRESTDRLYDHGVLACALRALNSMSGLVLLYHKASSDHEQATERSSLRLRCTL